MLMPKTYIFLFFFCGGRELNPGKISFFWFGFLTAKLGIRRVGSSNKPMEDAQLLTLFFKMGRESRLGGGGLVYF